MRHNAMKIGELAKSTGTTAKTIRYYESIKRVAQAFTRDVSLMSCCVE